MRFNEIFPFFNETNLSNKLVDDIQRILVVTKEDLSNLRKEYNLKSFLTDDQNNLNCDYYDSDEFIHLTKSLPDKNFSFFHTNMFTPC